MAEIKSAIELAMERTKNLRLSSEEKEKLKEEEIHSRAQGLVNRYLEAGYHLREVEKELGQYDPQQRAQIEKLMLQCLSAAIQLDKNNDLVFQGIETLREGSQRITGKIRELLKKYQEQRGKEYGKIKKDLLLKFERLGISGSAVEPKVEGSQEWEDALAEFTPDFEDQLRFLREGLNQLPQMEK